jgi:hypothetical protein
LKSEQIYSIHFFQNLNNYQNFNQNRKLKRKTRKQEAENKEIRIKLKRKKKRKQSTVKKNQPDSRQANEKAVKGVNSERTIKVNGPRPFTARRHLKCVAQVFRSARSGVQELANDSASNIETLCF